jgi:ligand-binding SRPBCC domain-containing protein
MIRWDGCISYFMQTWMFNEFPLGDILQRYTSRSLKKFNHSFLVDSSVDKAWDFYTDLSHLQVITPKNLDLRIIESSGKKITLGQTASFSSNVIIRITWKTKITFCEPYKYVDEMSNVLFKRWRHTHVFNKTNDNQTRITDEIEFELQFGFAGRMFEWYAMAKLKKIFRRRQMATIKALRDL